MIKIIFFVFVFAALNFSQTFQREINSIPFFKNDTLLQNIFSGGANNLEHQFIDIDGDNDYDLFFVDSDDSFGWFKNIGDSASPIFEYQIDFINGLNLLRWFYFADMDSDGDYDCFSSTTDNFVRYYKNVGTKFSPNYVVGIDTVKSSTNEIIMGEPGSNPVFVDVDSDGDYDFVSGNSSGSVTFYENTGNPSSFILTYITSNWKNILIISNLDHGASAIDFADMDFDGDLDILWGDFFSKSLYYLQNTGTALNAEYNLLHRVYPQNADSLITSGFNMPRLVDIDADDDLDLFVSVLYDPSVPQSLIYFENFGNKFIPNLKRKTFNFLPALDEGIQSVPAIADIDGDGAKDIFIGYGNNPSGSIAYYKQVKSLNHYYFAFVTDTFASAKGELSNAAAFGDIDADGDLDLLVGRFDGTIHLHKNRGNQFNFVFDFDDTLKNSAGTKIDIGLYARPSLIDVDGDGDLDLITGRFNGRISFFRNVGGAWSYAFEEDANYFGALDVGDNSAPILFDYNGDSKLDLFAGNRNGFVHYYKNDGTIAQPVWNLVTDKYLNFFFGSEVTPLFTDLDGDGDADFLAGNYRGGLYFFRNQTILNLEPSEISPKKFMIVEAYPNPFNPIINIFIKNIDIGRVEISIYNLVGQRIIKILDEALEEDHINLKWNAVDDFGIEVQSGIYFLKVSTNTSVQTKKILFLK